MKSATTKGSTPGRRTVCSSSAGRSTAAKRRSHKEVSTFSLGGGQSFEKVLLSSETDYQGDECGQIANEMIVIVYEKMEKIRLQIRAVAGTKRGLEMERIAHREDLKDFNEVIKRLEKDKEKLEGDYEQIVKDVAKASKSVEEVTESVQKASFEQNKVLSDLSAKVDEARQRVEKQKTELLEMRDKTIPIENQLADSRASLELKVRVEDKGIEDLRKEVRIARAREDARVKQFKSNSKTLDFALIKGCVDNLNKSLA